MVLQRKTLRIIWNQLVSNKEKIKMKSMLILRLKRTVEISLPHNEKRRRGEFDIHRTSKKSLNNLPNEPV